MLQAISAARALREEPGHVEKMARSGSPAATDEEIKALTKVFRYGATPGDEEALDRMNIQIDIREVLPTIRVPTLVLQNDGDLWVEPARGRDMAKRIPGASYVEIPVQGHIPALTEVGLVMDEMQRFLQNTWADSGSEATEPDRVLATVLFTDIVGSSERASTLGDRAWRQLLERHHELVRRELARFRGVEVDTAGDGFLASFDGPARAIRCANAISQSLREIDLDVRAGLHTGECELVDGKVAGIAVHTGARVAALAGPGEVLVSSTVKDLVAGSGIEFDDRGAAELKGIPGEWRLFAVAP